MTYMHLVDFSASEVAVLQMARVGRQSMIPVSPDWPTRLQTFSVTDLLTL